MIKLYNDDCFKIMKQLKEENVKVDAIICDPPYVFKDGKKVSTDHMTSFDIDWSYDRKTEVTVRSE